MCNVAVNIPEDVLFDMRMTEREAASFAQRMTALGLYGIGACRSAAAPTSPGCPRRTS